MPATRLPTTARPPAGDQSNVADGSRPVSARRARAVRSGRLCAAALVVALAAALATGPAGAQVDRQPEPTTTVVETTVAPTTMAPTTVQVTTTVPITQVPTTFVTTSRPVVTTTPVTTARPAVAQASTTTTSSPSSTTSSTDRVTTTTAGLLVEGTGAGTATVTTEPVAETDGLDSTAKLRLIVAALIAMAVLVAAMTVLYWRKTRPYEWEEWEEEDDDAGDEPDGPAAPDTVGVADRTRLAAAVGSTAAATDRDPVADDPAAPPAPATPPPADAPASGPVVPSLIDPDLRARLSSSPVSPASGDPAVEARATGSADTGPATQAMPVVATPGPAPAPASPASPPAEPTPPTEAARASASTTDPSAGERWGTARLAADQPPVADPGRGPDDDPDAAFRPPAGGQS